MNDFENNVSVESNRRRYLTGNEDVNELTLKLVKDAVSRRINVTGPLIQSKALDFASSLNKTDFKASNGWLESFKQRNNIVYGTMSGERGDVNVKCVDDWKSKFGELCAGFEPKDILNMDETGLFFKDTSRQTFHFKGDDCAGGKRSQKRITVLLCASFAGEKFKPLVIGKSKRPRCFKNIETDSLHVHYYYNSKAWMNSKIYEDYLKKLNRKMRAQNRNVLLFVDNAPSHPELTLSNISVRFLPPNTTSFTQPMDQGIIQAAKLKFRKRQMNHMVKEMDRQTTVSGPCLLKHINILDAIYWMNNSWLEVEESTITKCFKKAGFCVAFQVETNEVGISSEISSVFEVDDDISLSVLKLSYDLFGCSFTDLVSLDEHVKTCDTDKIDWDKPSVDLLDEFKNQSSFCESESDDDIEPIEESDLTNSQHVPTLSDATQMVTKLKAFALHSGEMSVLNLVSKLDDELSQLVSKNKKQSKITDFFERLQ